MQEKEYYPIIMLIIASENLPEYKEMKKISIQYYSKFSDKIRFFYLYCKPEEYSNEYDLCFSGSYESLIPGAYYKTTKAVQFVDNYYNYNFLIRTNISTYWNIYNLLYLIEKLPKRRYAGGAVSTINAGVRFTNKPLPFISGYAMIFSKDVAYNLFINNNPFQDLYYLRVLDDIMIAKKLAEWGYNLKNIEDYTIYSLCDNNYDEKILSSMEKEEFHKILAFRIKNELDRSIDVKYMQQLNKLIYKI